MRDPRVAENESLPDHHRACSRVIVELGDLSHINPSVIEGLFAADLAYLQDFYGIINFGDPALLEELESGGGPTEAGSEAPPTPAKRAAKTDQAGAPYRLMRSSVDEVWADVTYLAYHLHWELDTILDLEHPDRRRMAAGVSRLNDQAWQELRSREGGCEQSAIRGFRAASFLLEIDGRRPGVLHGVQRPRHDR